MFTRHFNRQRYRSLLPNFWQQKVIILFTYINKKETTARTSTLRRLVSNQQVENPLIAGISFSIIILYQINKNVKHRFDT